MNSKEIKSRLKEAREAIRVKDFESAASHCNAVLEAEEANYNALVFLGVAYEGLNDVNQALKVYKQATVKSPDQLLAWQGIGSMLEKDPSLLDLQERITIFEKLQSFTSGTEGKRILYLHKLVSLYTNAKNVDKAYNTLEELLQLDEEKESRVTLCKTMVDLLRSKDLSQDENLNSRFQKCLEELLDCSTLTEDDINRYTKLSLLLPSMDGQDLALCKWKDLRLKFPKAIPPIEFGLQFHLDKTIGCSAISESMLKTIQDLCEELKDLSAENDMMRTAQGFLYVSKNNHIQAKQCLMGVSPSILSAQFYLCQTYLRFQDPENCLKVSNKGLQACSDPKAHIQQDFEVVQDMFKLVQAEAHRQIGSEEDKETALKIIAQVQDRKPTEALIIKANLYLDHSKLEDAQNCISLLPQDDVNVKLLVAAMLMMQKQYVNCLEILEGILAMDPEHAVATLKKGIVLWELKDSSEIDNSRQLCFTSLLKAAKLDPYNYESFLYLGFFYEQIQKDINKAIRCFRKAYDLNPDSDVAGCAYVDSLSDQKEQSQVQEILQAVTLKAPAGKAKWAWLRLGLYQMKFADPSTAITSLQSALRADPKDNHVWECLSEAYLHRGSLTAALKAFTKASELNPDSIYCLYQIANINQTLGLLPEAVQQYKTILEREPTYVAALKGLGESLIQSTRQHLHQCLDGLAQDNIEEAVQVLTRAATHRSDFSCVWKLMGDSCSFVSCLASNSYRIPSKLIHKGSEGQEMANVTKEQVLQIGSKCYSQAIKIMPENASLWHDLGVNLYRQSHQHHQEGHMESAKEVLHRARKTLGNALRLEPKNWRQWNALGVTACSKVDPNLPFAQHCFIKSIECEANNVVAWSNIGVLYLSEGDIGLSHNAFKVAQRLDPTYLVGWLGQAFIAELVGHEEAMDLFRHTTELGVHLESALGYGQQVLSMLLDEGKYDSDLYQLCIHRMAAIPAASDALIKYTVRVQTDPVAYNMLGLLLEHQELFSPSVKAFAKSLELLEKKDKKAMTSQVRMNYARALCFLGQYRESFEQFELLGSDLNLDHLFIFALTAYKMENYVESFKLYSLALDQVSENESLKSQVHAAIALVAFKAGDLEEAKTQLFNSFQTQSPSLHGLLAMCALGLNQSDLTLATAAVEELKKRTDKDPVIDKIASLILYKHILEGNTADGESFLKALIKSQPRNAPRLLMVLASFLINSFDNRGVDALDCIKEVDDISGNLDLSVSVTKVLAQLQDGGLCSHNTDADPFKLAQKAFHQNPGDVSAIAAVACAAHVEGVLRKPSNRHLSLFQWEKSLLSRLQQQLDSEGKQEQKLSKRWIVQLLIVCCAELGDTAMAQQYLHILEEDEQVKGFVEAMTLFLYATPIDEWSKKENLMSVMVMCSLSASEQHTEAFFETLRKIIQKPESCQRDLSISGLVEMWTHTAFKEIHPKRLNENNEMESLFCDGISLAKEQDVKSPIVSIMQAVRLFNQSKRDAKHHFATALDQCEKRKDASSCKSVARQGLMCLLSESAKDSDRQLVEALMKDAESEMDFTTVELYQKLFKH